jgi:hypothetical protein
MQFYATKGTNMNFITTLLALFKKTPTTPAETPPEEIDYLGFPTAETADLMRYLEQYNYAVGTATDGIKTAHVEVKMYLDSKNYHKSIDSRSVAVRARIDNGMHKQPYVCYLAISTFREWDTPLEYTKTYIDLHCSMLSAVAKSSIIPDDEKMLIRYALHDLKKGRRDERFD